MVKEKQYRIILGLVIVLMLMPATMIHLNLLPPIYLDGVIQETEKRNLSWMDGTAQKQFDEKLFDSTDFKSLCIRSRNEFQYSLFGKINAQSTYVFDDYFYRFYVHNYNEDIFKTPQDSINNTLQNLIELQRLVGEKCPIICIIPPSKTRLFPEHLPERHKSKSTTTNYDQYKTRLLKNNFTVLDFNDYFVKNKNNFDAAIIAKGGIHWTYYAATLAMDSLVKTVSTLKNQDFNQFTFSLSDCDGFNVDDQDLAVLSNLIFDRKDPNIKKVNLKQSQKIGKKINAVIVGDSFFHAIEQSDLRNLVFTSDTDFHYYFQTTKNSLLQKSPINLKKIKEQLQKADCIILINDIVNFEKFTFGFADKMIREFKK